MGIFHVTMEVGDPQGRRFESVSALVDTGASITVMPESLLRRLGVAPTRVARFQDASGRIQERGVADIPLRVEGMDVTASVMFGEEGIFLLGSQTLEGLQLGVDPTNKRLVPVIGMVMKATQDVHQGRVRFRP